MTAHNVWLPVQQHGYMTLYDTPTMAAHKDNLHPIAELQPAPLKCVLKLQCINCTTVVVARILNCPVYIVGGQDWTGAVVSRDIMII